MSENTRNWHSVANNDGHYAYGTKAPNGAIESVIAVIKYQRPLWNWFVAAHVSGSDKTSGKELHLQIAINKADEILINYEKKGGDTHGNQGEEQGETER